MEPIQHRKPTHRPTPPVAWALAVLAAAALLVACMAGLALSDTWAGRIFAGVVLLIDWAVFGWLMVNRPSKKPARTA